MEESRKTIMQAKTNEKRNRPVVDETISVFRRVSYVRSTSEVQRSNEGLRRLTDKDIMEGCSSVIDTRKIMEERNRREKMAAAGRSGREPSGESIRKVRYQPYECEKPKREESRRDPSKSTKDIEKDKMRAKRDNDNKLLAEKEKAINILLDSESEALQNIVARQNKERAKRRNRRSRKSQEKTKLRPTYKKIYDRSRAESPCQRNSSLSRRRSPFNMGPERRSSPRMDSDRSRSPYRRSSRGRKSSSDSDSAERHRRRTGMDDRRRTRSRGRSRSSLDSYRRRSRSSMNRKYSPRRTSRTSRGSFERRTRKRSPFINELTRQLRKEAMASNSASHITSSMEVISPTKNAPSMYPQERDVRQPMSQPYIHQGGSIMAAQQPHPMLPPMSSGVPPYTNYEMSAPTPSLSQPPPPPPPPPMGYDATTTLHTMQPSIPHYSAGPIMYNQNPVQTTNPVITAQTGTTMYNYMSTPQPATPQPVPAPGTTVMGYGLLPLHVSSHVGPTSSIGNTANASATIASTSSATLLPSSSMISIKILSCFVSPFQSSLRSFPR